MSSKDKKEELDDLTLDLDQMNESKIGEQVARSLYAQMCYFHEETEEQHIISTDDTKRTSMMVQGIGTLLLVFVIVIAFYINQLSGLFIEIVENMDSMNNKVANMTQEVSHIKNDIVHMNDSVSHMHEVLANMQHLNKHVDGMRQNMGNMTTKLVHMDQMGGEVGSTLEKMNREMSKINNTTGHMGVRMRQIAKPVKLFPKP